MQDWCRRDGTPPDDEPGDWDEGDLEEPDEPDEPDEPETCNRARRLSAIAAIKHAPRHCVLSDSIDSIIMP